MTQSSSHSNAQHSEPVKKPGNESSRTPPDNDGHFIDEADIGSGEKTPGQLETDEHIKSIPPLPPHGGKQTDQTGRKQ